MKETVRKAESMFRVADMRATIAWYESLGFTTADRYEDDCELVFARITFGGAGFALGPGGHATLDDASVWFFTDAVEESYAAFRAKGVTFEEQLYEPFYGGRQFSFRDCNGLALVFWTAPNR